MQICECTGVVAHHSPRHSRHSTVAAPSYCNNNTGGGIVCVCVWEYARALRWLWRCVFSSAWQQPATPGGGEAGGWENWNTVEQQLMGNRAQSYSTCFLHTHVLPIFFFYVHIKQSITKTQSASFITCRDKSDSIKTNSVTAERQQQVGMKCCVTSICR